MSTKTVHPGDFVTFIHAGHVCMLERPVITLVRRNLIINFYFKTLVLGSLRAQQKRRTSKLLVVIVCSSVCLRVFLSVFCLLVDWLIDLSVG